MRQVTGFQIKNAADQIGGTLLSREEADAIAIQLNSDQSAENLAEMIESTIGGFAARDARQLAFRIVKRFVNPEPTGRVTYSDGTIDGKTIATRPNVPGIDFVEFADWDEAYGRPEELELDEDSYDRWEQ